MNPLVRLREAAGAFVETLRKPDQPMREARGITIDPDEDQWRALTGNTNRDLSPLTQRRMRELAVYLWESNLLANRLIELPTSYLLAEGVSLTVPNPDAQIWLDAFWRDPINNMDLKLTKKVRELFLYGEQCWPAFVNEFSGHTRIGCLDPELIETVVTDPDNAEQPIGIITKKNRKGESRRYRVIVNGPEEVFTTRTIAIRETFTDGECFFYRINDLTSGRRGRSLLLSSIDWCDAYESFLFGEQERGQFLRAFLWDITLKGATPEEVEKRARQITTPAPGSTRVHNDSEEWKALAPPLGQYESAAGARMFRNHILGGQTIPEHWFGGGGDVNRSTGESMGEPTFKSFSMHQRNLKHILEEVGSFVIWRRLDPSGRSAFDPEKPDPELMPEAMFPELTAKDTTKYAAALQQVTAAVVIALDRNLITDVLAVRIVNSVAERLGVEFDAEEEIEAARLQADKEREDDSFVEPPEEELEAEDGQETEPENEA